MARVRAGAGVSAIGLTSIGEGAFAGCTALETVENMPDTVTEIGNEAFADCAALTAVELSENLTTIGDNAFADCAALTSVTIPESVTNVGSGAFENTGWLSEQSGDVVVGSTLVSYAGTETQVTVQAGITRIADAFKNNTTLTSVTIPSGVTEIGSNAFSGCTALREIVIPDSVTRIDSGAFTGTPWYEALSATTIVGDGVLIKAVGVTGKYVVADTVKYIAEAFKGNTALTMVRISESVTGIGAGAFSDCTALKLAYLPDTLTAVADDAFGGCTSLGYVYFMGDAPMVSGTAAGANPLGVTVYYRAGASGWDASEWSNAAAITPGDIGGNGDVGMTDAVAFLQKLVQGNGATYTDAEFLAADVVRDGALGMTDIVRLLRSFVDTTIVLK